MWIKDFKNEHMKSSRSNKLNYRILEKFSALAQLLFIMGSTKPTLNAPPYILAHKVELTILMYKIIVSILASAHELRYHHIKVSQVVGTTLSKSGI